VIPFHRLPEGFLRWLDDPPETPAYPRPSSTLVLLRKGGDGLEVLLMKRSPRSGFIPGAWVFPGGTVDQEDGHPDLLARVDGISPETARDRLQPATPQPPALAYWVTAIRETFEETGILLGSRVRSHRGPGSVEELVSTASARSELLAGQTTFGEVLTLLGVTPDAGSLEYIGHWLTPECEPRRYETRFFAAEAEPDARAIPHQKEMVDAVWLAPRAALSRNRDGDFPLALPTLFTLEELAPFQTPAEALENLRGRPVPRRLPVPERAEGGVRFHLAD
jgi:8-oxo-dGTP pyrophosphatase MutT (NUDIX family)